MSMIMYPIGDLMKNTGTLLHDENGTNTLDASAFNTTWNSSGKYGIAVEFDGSTSYAYVSDSTNSPLDITDSITVSAWVYQHQATAQQMFVDKGYYRYVIASETAPTFYGYIDITGANSPTALPLNSWQYTTMTWNGSVIKVYENGAYKGQTNKADAITTDNNDLRFGNHYTNSSYFDGLLDEIRIYNRTLSEAEINQTRDNQHDTSGNLTSIVKDSETIGVSGDVWKKLKIEGQNTTQTWFHGYWNYSLDNSSYQLQDLGNVTAGTNYTLTNARYGSFIIELNTANSNNTPELYNVTLFTGAGGFALTVTSPANTTYSTNNITISGSTNGNANITYSMNGAANISVCDDCTSFSTWNDSTTEGQNNITLYAINSTNSSQADSKTVYFTIDTTPPQGVTEQFRNPVSG